MAALMFPFVCSSATRMFSSEKPIAVRADVSSAMGVGSWVPTSLPWELGTAGGLVGVGGSVVVCVTPVVTVLEDCEDSDSDSEEKESMTPLAMSRTVSARRTMASRVGSRVGGGRGLTEEGLWKEVEGERRSPSRPRASSGEGPLSGGRKSRRGLWHDGHCICVSFSYTNLHSKHVNAFISFPPTVSTRK